jgi:hypothetical protein
MRSVSSGSRPMSSSLDAAAGAAVDDVDVLVVVVPVGDDGLPPSLAITLGDTDTGAVAGADVAAAVVVAGVDTGAVGATAAGVAVVDVDVLKVVAAAADAATTRNACTHLSHALMRRSLATPPITQVTRQHTITRTRARKITHQIQQRASLWLQQARHYSARTAARACSQHCPRDRSCLRLASTM